MCFDQVDDKVLDIVPDRDMTGSPVFLPMIKWRWKVRGVFKKEYRMELGVGKLLPYRSIVLRMSRFDCDKFR